MDLRRVGTLGVIGRVVEVCCQHDYGRAEKELRFISFEIYEGNLSSR